ncbi:hypothetical protein V8G54_011051 [Vigna mungo]|uniref:Uncharacterized protein n=1 Tax=Vigna mungo TaxID=3915 RepID=A0AAQ3NN13_VIGMU
MSISNIHWQLINTFEPCPWKLSSKTIVTKQNVSHTISLSTRKPSGNQSINFLNIWFYNHWTTRDYHSNTFHSSTHIFYGFWPRCRDCQIQTITICFSIWLLSNYHNGI